jgi:hypothetical protein
MAIYVYLTSNGALYSYCPNDTDPVASDAQLAAQGMAKKSGLLPLDATHQWDPTTLTVIVVTAPTPVNLLATYDFIMAFTAAELAAIRGTTSDNNIQQWLFAFQTTQGLNLNHGSVTTAMNYLVSHGLLTQARANTILATIGSGATGGPA